HVRLERIVAQAYLQFVFQDGNRRSLLRSHIISFFRIRCHVVELGNWCVDIVIAGGLQGMERAPTERTEGIKSFTIGCLIIFWFRTKKTVRLKLLLDGILDPSRLQQRGSDIDGLYRPRNATSPKAAPSRGFNDHRHTYR